MFRLAGARFARYSVCRSLVPVVVQTNNSLRRISVISHRFVSAKTTKFPEQLKTNTDVNLMPENDFVHLAKSTLDHITEQLEALTDDASLSIPDDFDVSFNGDVLTLRLGAGRGTYVLNTQTPNRQIWLSSPVSGPKRFDWMPETGSWVYKHDGSELGYLLSNELTKTFKADIIINPYVTNA